MTDLTDDIAVLRDLVLGELYKFRFYIRTTDPSRNNQPGLLAHFPAAERGPYTEVLTEEDFDLLDAELACHKHYFSRWYKYSLVTCWLVAHKSEQPIERC